MAKISVFYDYYEDKLVPQKMAVYYGRGVIDWSKEKAIISLAAPFKRKLAEDFSDEVLSLAISIDDLILLYDRPNHFGIHLPTVKNRLNQTRGDMMPFDRSDIEQFIIQMSDIEEIMQMDLEGMYDWRE
ncbi:hypothetical protein [Paenibacillus cymbidii]|uniref:hypothetical protein n=1 Tax=Paenibacillus cymbidii TaxID=1639034 RepID=UPI0010820C03|nr:hypothetical protein [Paenibacillus cymbidii]